MTIDTSNLDAFLGFQIKQTHQFISAKFSRVLKQFDLTPAEVNTLILIDSNPNVSQADLARTLGIERASFGEFLSKLERKEMIERKSSKTDRRAKTLVLSRKKKNEIQKLFNTINVYDSDVRKPLSNKELASLKSYLERLRN